MKKVVVCGQNEMGVRCLDVIAASGDQILAVYVPQSDTGKDTWQRSLRKHAESKGFPVYSPKSINSAAEVERLRFLNPDFLFSFQYPYIFKKDILGIAPAYNIHTSLLPKYRGRDTIAWSIALGEKETGATLHCLDAGIDTGDIVGQEKVSILPTDDARSVFEKVIDSSVRLMERHYRQIREGSEPKYPQRGSGNYHTTGEFDYTKKTLNLTGHEAEPVFNRARALIFPPLQLPEIEIFGKRIQIERVGLEGLAEFQDTSLAYKIPFDKGALLLYEVVVDGLPRPGNFLNDYLGPVDWDDFRFSSSGGDWFGGEEKLYDSP